MVSTDMATSTNSRQLSLTHLQLVLGPVDDDRRDLLVHEEEDGEKQGGHGGPNVQIPGAGGVEEGDGPAADVVTGGLKGLYRKVTVLSFFELPQIERVDWATNCTECHADLDKKTRYKKTSMDRS